MSLVVPLRKCVRRMRWYEPPPEGRAGRLRLDMNENLAGPSTEARRALGELPAEQISSYPEYGPARRRLARFFGVSGEELLVTNGVDDALRILCDGFAEAGRPVLIVEPTFAMYRFYADLGGARVVALRRDERMRFPLDEAVRTLERVRPRLLFLANPNNPTGALLGPRELRRILDAARRTMVVVDEAYYEFSGVTAIGWIRRRPNLVVLRTFSKAAGLAGLRAGCLMSNGEVVRALDRVREPFSVNSAALAAALAVVRRPGAMRRYAREVVAARGETERALKRMGIRVFPSAANFLLADFGAAGPRVIEALGRRGILLRDRRADFGRAGWVRITVGTRAQMREFAGELEKAWTRFRS